MTFLHRAAGSLLAPLFAASLLPGVAAAQSQPARADSVGASLGAVASPRNDHYWRDFVAGAATSLLLHEAAHVGTSLALGARPAFGFGRGRPTVDSGIEPLACSVRKILVTHAQHERISKISPPNWISIRGGHGSATDAAPATKFARQNLGGTDLSVFV